MIELQTASLITRATMLATGTGTAENTTETGAAEMGAQAIHSLQENWGILLIGIALVIGAVILWHIMKNLIGNLVLGLIAFVILKFVFAVPLPFGATLLVTAIFGLAGIGVMLILWWLGIVPSAP